jgi:uncharacterized RDD family membrane protein YckC
MKQQIAAAHEPVARSLLSRRDQHASRTDYADFLTRAVAFLIDGMLTFAINVITGGLALLIVFPCAALMEASKQQGTPGKIVLRMRVTDLEGNRVSLRRSLQRNFVKYMFLGIFAYGAIVSFFMALFTDDPTAFQDPLTYLVLSWPLPFLAPLMMAAFTRKRQALHDVLSGTLVTKQSVGSGDAPTRMSSTRQVIDLILAVGFLMIVIYLLTKVLGLQLL